LFVNSSLATIHLPPKIHDKPADLTYKVDTTGHSLSWTAEANELNDEPASYTVFRNGTALSEYTNQPWSDNVAIVVNVDGLAIGVYQYQIEIRDTGYPDNADASVDNVIVKVVETLPDTTTTSTTSSIPNSPTTDQTDTNQAAFPVVEIFLVLLLPVVMIRLRNRDY